MVLGSEATEEEEGKRKLKGFETMRNYIVFVAETESKRRGNVQCNQSRHGWRG